MSASSRKMPGSERSRGLLMSLKSYVTPQVVGRSVLSRWVAGRFVLSRCVWILLLLVPAYTQVRAEQPQARGLVIHSPELTPSTLEKLTRQVLPDRAGTAYDFEPLTDGRFLTPLRQQLMPARVSRLVGEALCNASSPGLERLVDQASEALDFLEVERAAGLLEAARLQVTCETRMLPTRTLGRYLFLQGVLEVQRERDASRLFADALAITEALPSPSDYSPAVQQAFAEGQRTFKQRARIQTQVELDALAELSLAIDGGLVDSSRPIVLSPGTHFVQLLARNGEALAGGTATVTPAHVLDSAWLPFNLRPPTEATLRSRIEREVRAGTLGTDLREGLRSWLEARSLPWVLFVVATDEPDQLRTAWLSVSGTLELSGSDPSSDSGSGRAGPKRPFHEPYADGEELGAPASESPGGIKAAPGILWTAGFGAVALGAGGVYGYSYARLSTHVFSDREEGLAVRELGRAAGLLGLLSVAGAAGSASWFWWQEQGSRHSYSVRIPPGADLEGRHRRSERGWAWKVTIQLQPTKIAIQGQW